MPYTFFQIQTGHFFRPLEPSAQRGLFCWIPDWICWVWSIQISGCTGIAISNDSINRPFSSNCFHVRFGSKIHGASWQDTRWQWIMVEIPKETTRFSSIQGKLRDADLTQTDVVRSMSPYLLRTSRQCTGNDISRAQEARFPKKILFFSGANSIQMPPLYPLLQ